MKVETWFLLRSRQAKKKKYNESRSDVSFNNGIYLMDSEAINFYSIDKKPKGVETFFYEGNSAPIKIDEDDKDTSINFLDRFLYEGVIEQTGSIPKERMKNSFGWIRNNVTVWGIIKVCFFLMIAGAVVGGYFDIW